jgi:hypothetical protein
VLWDGLRDMEDLQVALNKALKLAHGPFLFYPLLQRRNQRCQRSLPSRCQGGCALNKTVTSVVDFYSTSNDVLAAAGV